METGNCSISEAIFRTFAQFADELRQSQNYGGDYVLCHSEADFMSIVQQQPGINASGVSKKLSLTKGAVTQIYQKLYQKGLIETYRREDNKKERHFRLTSLGEEARQGYIRCHAPSNQRLCDYFSSLCEEDAHVVFRFLREVTECAPFSRFTCPYCGNAEQGGRGCLRAQDTQPANP